MNRKRLITLLLLICMTVCMTVSLSACGSKEKPAEPEEPAVTEEEAEVPGEAKSEFPKKMYVTAEDGLLLRKGPGKENDVVSVLSYGQEIQAEKTENGWACTTVDGNQGWCSMDYLTENKGDIKADDKSASSKADPNKLVEPTNTSVNGYHGYVDSPEGLNMRYGPGENYNVIAVVPDKTELTELGWEDGWVYVQYKDNYGWISAHYFTLEGGKEKPVIYLYPERTTDVTVRISLTDGRFTKCIPEGDGEWNVTASPDGKLTDKATGKTYDYIFWESTDNTGYDWSEGYVVKGSEAEVGISVNIVTVGSQLRVVRNICEKIFGQAYHLAAVESIEIADESVHLDAGFALLREGGKSNCRKGENCNYLLHIQLVKRKGISW